MERGLKTMEDDDSVLDNDNWTMHNRSNLRSRKMGVYKQARLDLCRDHT